MNHKICYLGMMLTAFPLAWGGEKKALTKAVQETSGAKDSKDEATAKKEPEVKSIVEMTGDMLNGLGRDLNAVLRLLQILEMDPNKIKTDTIEKIKNIIEQLKKIVDDPKISSFFGPENITFIENLTQQLSQKVNDALGAATIVKENREKIGKIYQDVNKNLQEFTSKAIESAEKNLL